MLFVDLPEPILEHIKKTVEREYEYDDRKVHVTELTGCILKAYLNRKLSEKIEEPFERVWYKYRGLIFDELWTGLFPRNQVRITHRIPDGPVITGRIDFIHDGKIFELKTINTIKKLGEPLSHHVKQVKFYAWCENIDKAVIIYVSFDGFKIFEIDCSDAYNVVKEFEEKALKLYKALKENKPPEPDAEEWECRYCDFYMVYCGGREIGVLREDV